MAEKQSSGTAAKQAAVRGIVLGATALTVLPKAAADAVRIAKGFSATVNGLEVEGHPTLEQCEKAGVALRVVERGAQFAIGDFVNFVEDAHGEAASQVLDAESGWSLKTISVYGWIAKRIAPERRRMDRLGIKHHSLVAKLSAAQQESWLTKAAADEEDEPWTVARLKAALEAGEDLPIERWFVVTEVPDGARQDSLMSDLEAQGLKCKASYRRRKREKAA